jgi:uncharacterized UBP type Zn finger protein
VSIDGQPIPHHALLTPWYSKISAQFNDTMTLLSSNNKQGERINPFIFHQICGTLFAGSDGQPMNGETQQDAHEFILKLLTQLKKEQPELDMDELFAAHFEERQVCKCGATKTFTEENSNFPIPDFLKGKRFDFESLVVGYLQDDSKFTDYRCEKCGESGKWSTKDGWRQKRMTKSPEYLIANVPRGQLRAYGNRSKKIKLTNSIIPPMKKISFPSADGGSVDYHMVAMIQHSGNR